MELRINRVRINRARPVLYYYKYANVASFVYYGKNLLHLGNWGIGCVGVNGVCADDWLVELTIVASNGVA